MSTSSRPETKSPSGSSSSETPSSRFDATTRRPRRSPRRSTTCAVARETASFSAGDAIRTAFKARPRRKTMVLLEHTAGQGRTLGHRFEHLASILGHLDGSPRVGVCLDTCHLLAAGYPLDLPADTVTINEGPAPAATAERSSTTATRSSPRPGPMPAFRCSCAASCGGSSAAGCSAATSSSRSTSRSPATCERSWT